MNPLRRGTRAAAIVAAGCISCFGGTEPKAPVVATVTVTASTTSLEAGDNTTLTAVASEAGGAPIPDAPITWSSSASGVISVSNSGVATGVGAGTATITATSGSANGTVQLTGTLTLETVTVAPGTLTLEAGDTTRLTASGRNKNNIAVPNITVTWASSATGVATVSSSGLVTGAGAGSASITGSSGGKSGTSTATGTLTVNAVSVAPPSVTVEAGDTTRLTASGTNKNGIAVPGATFTWTSSASGVATVNTSGLVTGAADGPSVVTATSNAKSGTSNVTGTLTVNSVTVTPATVSLEAGDTTRLSVSAANKNGLTVPTTGVTWSSSATGVATVSATGLLTGVSGGSTTATATLGTKSGTSAVTGTLTLDAITVSPSAVSLEAGDTTRLTASPRNKNAIAVPGVTVTWGSSATGVATVNTSGLLTGVSNGSATVTASGGGKNGASTVTGTLTANTVTVTPAAFSIEAGDTTQLTASAVNANNITVPTAGLTWSTSASSVATVNTSGRVIGAGAGSATITATLNTKSGTSATTGTLTAASLALGSANDTVRIAQTRQLAATVTSIRGIVMSGSSITWSTLAGGVASVSASGLVTGVGVGNTSVIATSGTKADTTAVRVNSRDPVFASLRASRYAAEVGRATTLIWSVSDPDGESLTCTIDRDNDGTADTTFTNCAASTLAAVTYPSGSGNKLLRITASDGQGGTASDTVTIALYAGNNLATGMNANLVLSAFGFNNSGGSGVYHHNAGMATDGTRFFLADRNNNRVLVWNTLPTSNVAPDFVLGQPGFLTNDPGSGLNQMNWPTAIAVGSGKLFVADGYNDRILVWNTIPTLSGTAADFALTGSGDLVKWPWGVWTNGTKLAATNTIEGKILIWNTIPTTGTTAANVVLKGSATFGSGGSPTPRSITSNGTMFAAADHNPPGYAVQGIHVWNAFPTSNVAPSYFSSAPEDPQYAWMQGDFTGDGKLYLFGRYIWGYNTVPTAATGADGISTPDFTIRSNTARLEGGDGSDLKFAGGRMYVSMSNGNRVNVYNSVPTADAEPSFALGAPTVSTNTAQSNYLITSPIPASDGRRLFVTSGFERRLYVWRSIPASSGTAPDAVFWFQSSGNTYDFQPADNTLFGNVLMAAGEKTIAIWTSLPLNGEAPTTMLRDNIGGVALTDIKGITYDGVNTYVTDGTSMLYVWAGVPTASSTPIFQGNVGAGVGRISSDGTTIMWSNGVSHRAKYCLVANLAGCTAPSTFGAALVPNLPSDVLIAGGRVFMVDGGFNRIQVWNSVASATGGAAPDVILGKPNTSDVTPRIGQSQLFWPGTIAYDGRNVWVGEFKFSGRLVAYPLP
ncbi:MAG: Ig-like domain-containing protein [Gemmatimonadota bacterium]